LAISRKYVQLMGGDISVSSTSGIGSTFTFNIQIALACPREIPPHQIKFQTQALAATEKAYRILVVDDSQESRLLLVKILTSVGFEVREAVNGQEAVASWESWQPDLIFMDMRMPVMDGYEATRMIKGKQIGDGKANRLRRFAKFKQLTSSGSQHLSGGFDSGDSEILYPASPISEVTDVMENDTADASTLRSPTALIPADISEAWQNCYDKHTIIIALTASAFEEERQKILSIGCDDFIRKPFSQEVLLEKLSQHLGVKYTNQVENLNIAVTDQATQTNVSVAELLSLLSQMPSDLVQKIHYAAASCSDELILELIQQIPADNVQVSQVIRDLANNYQFEKIMELTRKNVE
jgi:CheY-like chemotaxis protein